MRTYIVLLECENFKEPNVTVPKELPTDIVQLGPGCSAVLTLFWKNCLSMRRMCDGKSQWSEQILMLTNDLPGTEQPLRTGVTWFCGSRLV